MTMQGGHLTRPEMMDIDLGKLSIKIMKARDLDHEKGIERKRFR